MTLVATRETLARLLSDKSNQVIALSGKWGAGKSYLWDDVRKKSHDDDVKKALYVSLFGVATLAQFQTRIIQSALANLDEKGFWSRVGRLVERGRGLLEKVDKRFSAIDDLAVLVSPSILANRVIAIDDIERKHKGLTLDEVLGFIDEHTKRHGARIILILNSDKLDDIAVWETLREKVIDQEIKLETSTTEAFEIARSLVPTAHGEIIEKATMICRITNIRVLCKIIRVVNNIVGGDEGASDAFLRRVIPPTVLLAAIHYKGIENGPEMKYVLNPYAGEQFANAENGKGRDWHILLSELGFSHAGEFEFLIAAYLQSGLIDSKALSQVVSRLRDDVGALEARELVSTFAERAVWNHALTDADLLLEATELLPVVGIVNASTATLLYKKVLDLKGGGKLANQIAEVWLQTVQADRADEYRVEEMTDDVVLPRFREAMIQANEAVINRLSVVDVCSHFAHHNSWGERQRSVMRNATVGDFDNAIRSLEPNALRDFLRQCIQFCNVNYGADFNAAMEKFFEACRGILDSEPNSRLAKLLNGVVQNARLGHRLVAPAEPRLG